MPTFQSLGMNMDENKKMIDELDKIDLDFGCYFWYISRLTLRDPSELEGLTLLDKDAVFVLCRCKCN